MRGLVSILLCVLTVTVYGCQTKEGELSEEDRAAITEALQNPDLRPLFDAWGDPYELLSRFRQGQRRAAEEWARNQAAITETWDIGTTKTLRILPLVDWHTAEPSLKGEQGVSYLVITDEVTVLLDLGRNADQEHPSPLLHNMSELGVSLDDFEVIVISHDHDDHVGSSTWSEQPSFSLTNQPIELGQKAVYTPVPMTYPGLAPIHSEDPTRIARGIGTTGVISNALFFIGYAQEQALAVNVEGKGIVIITGCGHQTLPRLLERADALFDKPVYGIVGGLHTTIADSRVEWNGVPVLVYVGTGRVPWKPVTVEDVRAQIRQLTTYNPGVVAVSGHDSGDQALELFQEAFGDAFRVIEVGGPIVIGSDG